MSLSRRSAGTAAQVNQCCHSSCPQRTSIHHSLQVASATQHAAPHMCSAAAKRKQPGPATGPHSPQQVVRHELQLAPALASAVQVRAGRSRGLTCVLCSCGCRDLPTACMSPPSRAVLEGRLPVPQHSLLTDLSTPRG